MAGHDLAAERRGARRRGPSAIAADAAADHRPADRVGVQPEHEPERRASAAGRAASIEWAASPANSARAASAREADRARPRRRAAARAARTAPAASGWRGKWTTGPRSSAASSSASRRAARTAAARRVRRGAEAVGGLRRPSARGPPPGRRRAGGRPGRRDGRARRPCAARSSVRKNGEASASGMDRRADVVAEAGERQLRGPRRRRRSSRPPRRRATERPARASVIAAARPFGPDPTTTASGDGASVSLSRAERAAVEPDPLPGEPLRGGIPRETGSGPGARPAGRSAARRPTARVRPGQRRDLEHALRPDDDVGQREPVVRERARTAPCRTRGRRRGPPSAGRSGRSRRRSRARGSRSGRRCRAGPRRSSGGPRAA